VPLDDYFEYYNVWQTAIEQKKDFQVLLVQFEAMKKVRTILFNELRVN